MSSTIKINQHLFQMYPSMPKYAADPSQSQIILIYDRIMLRFTGHYGCQPSYFVKSPLCPILFGDSHKYISLPTVSFSSSQNIIIAISKSNSKKIRLNHYETTLYGQLQLQTNIEEWKFNKNVFEESQANLSHGNTEQKLKNQQHNIVMKVLRTFAQNNNMKELDSGLDILVYKDFIEEEYLYSKQAFIYGLYTAIHTVLLSKTPLEQKLLHKAYQKISDASLSHVLSLPQLIHTTYNNLAWTQSSQLLSFSSQQKAKQILFSEGFSLLIANTMTPLPKKLTKGKRFNLRQCQIQIGIELIKQQFGIVKQIRSIKQLMQNVQYNAKQMLDTVESVLPKKNVNTEKIESILEKPLIQILKHIPYANNVLDQNVQFCPYNRFKFFLEQQILINSLLQSPSQKSLPQLLDISFSNATSLLQVSSQQIQEIHKIAKQYKASIKILGNGWGGCVAILCKQQICEQLQKALIQKFYLAQKNRILLGDDIDVYLKIVNKPQIGLSVLDPINQIWYG